MKGVFSSSKYASSNQMCKRAPPKAVHQLFISSLKEIAVGHFHWAEIGGTGRSTPCVWCIGVSHVSFLDFACQILTVTCGSPDASGAHWTHAQRVSQTCGSPDPCAERVAKRPHTGR